ncbi:hypothetical protein Acr_28g0008350 [Actinidia rufa]|uniref:Uncharacterized protein n=1 Tax=Actinidia rufa TaxID=165716 RepID=A0A7J0HAJ3_9ERIC|nr:hypothetical protein Acr_28g0008350 [Actinidia rufa]
MIISQKRWVETKGFKPDQVTCRTMVKAYTTGGMTNHAKELQEFLALSGKNPTDMERYNHR